MVRGIPEKRPNSRPRRPGSRGGESSTKITRFASLLRNGSGRLSRASSTSRSNRSRSTDSFYTFSRIRGSEDAWKQSANILSACPCGIWLGKTCFDSPSKAAWLGGISDGGSGMRSIASDYARMAANAASRDFFKAIQSRRKPDFRCERRLMNSVE